MKPVLLISGALANKPFNGGNAWSRLCWILGFQRLGFQVCFVEQIRADCCVDAHGAPADFLASANVAFFHSVTAHFGLADSAALLCDDGRQIGTSLDELIAQARQAEMLFNLSGHLIHPELKPGPAGRIYYDDDPGFTQFWHAAGGDGARLGGHEFFFTLGANIGSAACSIPTGGIHWRSTRPPVALEQWPNCAAGAFDRFTTVASWRGAFGTIQHGGRTFGQKAHEFRKFITLPRRTERAFEIALQIHPGDQRDLDALHAANWRIADPNRTCGTPDAFRAYVQASSAEFSVAQGIYVDTHSGWFSDRTVRYLASGKPVLVQDTGFSQHLPTGEGLLTFRTLEEAIHGVEQLTLDYPRHAQAARRIAEEHFAADHVLRRLAADIGWKLPAMPPSTPRSRTSP